MAGPFLQTAGRAIITNLLTALGGVAPKWGAVGTGAGPANNTATALTTEVETRGVGTLTQFTTSTTNDTFQCVVISSMTATRAITEVGLFDQLALGGNCLVMSSITVINLLSGDSLSLTYRVAFS